MDHKLPLSKINNTDHISQLLSIFVLFKPPNAHIHMDHPEINVHNFIQVAKNTKFCRVKCVRELKRALLEENEVAMERMFVLDLPSEHNDHLTGQVNRWFSVTAYFFIFLFFCKSSSQYSDLPGITEIQ